MEYIKNVTKIKIDQNKCIGCGICVDVCPHNVISINDKIAYLSNKDRCIECGACDKNCPTNALEVETGVGCAYAIINSWFIKKGKKENTSGCC